MKCNRVGCQKEATRHSQVDLGNGMTAELWFCDEHYKDGLKSVLGEIK